MREPGQPTHLFEHLACFLPGLLALGAHTLPLHRLHTLGIDLNKLGEGMDKDTSMGYKILAGYNLRQLHLWAADGLAQTCYLSYADQVTGVGPEELYMTPADNGQWIYAMERWKRSGARSLPPGVGVKEPVLVKPKREADGPEPAQLLKAIRDYDMKRTEYFLRPEVSFPHLMSF
jgi:hypothetical protein